ncbi:MAG: SOS response-associated peptidase family protein [Gammaproteobacteria bacterium]|nr:SOS response-associated peptidase family protein [Gammaproteobacteria bacterium]
MCGRFNLINSPEIQRLCETLGVTIYANHASHDIAPGDKIVIIHNEAGARKISEATWWLFLDKESLKPNYKYASFNSRSDKLFNKRAIAYKPFRESRCLIPASAFVEGFGDKKTYHKIELENSAIAFGGLYKEYLSRETGEIIYSASIITLPPLVPQWNEIHPKSIPLMLDFEDSDLIEKWLDPRVQDVEQFESLLDPKVSTPMTITKIDKPSKWNPIEESFMIQK